VYLQDDSRHRFSHCHATYQHFQLEGVDMMLESIHLATHLFTHWQAAITSELSHFARLTSKLQPLGLSPSTFVLDRIIHHQEVDGNPTQFPRNEAFKILP
jgi:hypothetical protein